MHRALPPLLLAAVMLAGCRAAPVAGPAPEPASPAAQPPEPSVDAAPAAPRLDLPATWRETSDLAFERALDAWIPPGEARSFSPADLAVLETYLAAGDATAVRAAALLGRSRDPGAGEILLARLEKRVPPPAGPGELDAADVVAAAAFTTGATGPNAVGRLATLAAGRRPHPDPFVRVECTRSALHLGRDEGIPYLLQVLRIGTPAGRPRGPLESEEDVAWLQTRAAGALSARAGTENRFVPEASVKDRETEAARLEALLPRPPEKKR